MDGTILDMADLIIRAEVAMKKSYQCNRRRERTVLFDRGCTLVARIQGKCRNKM